MNVRVLKRGYLFHPHLNQNFRISLKITKIIRYPLRQNHYNSSISPLSNSPETTQFTPTNHAKPLKNQHFHRNHPKINIHIETNNQINTKVTILKITQNLTKSHYFKQKSKHNKHPSTEVINFNTAL